MGDRDHPDARQRPEDKDSPQRPHDPARGPLPGQRALSAREVDVLVLVSDGLTNRQIAEALYISAETVKTHVARLCRKLDARNRTEAVSKAGRLRMIASANRSASQTGDAGNQAACLLGTSAAPSTP